MFMILPTLSLAIYITWKNRAERAELFHNLAVCFWISANSIWMYGEFYLDDIVNPTSGGYFLRRRIAVDGLLLPDRDTGDFT